MMWLRGGSTVLALLSTAYAAGVFLHWSATVMPALRNRDDQFLVLGFKELNRAILRPLFLGFGFLGSVVFTAAAALLNLGGGSLPWVLAALVLNLVTVVVTFRVHLPSNAVIEQSGEPLGPDEAARLRAEFDDARWVRWNHLRAVGNSLALVSLVAANSTLAAGL